MKRIELPPEQIELAPEEDDDDTIIGKAERIELPPERIELAPERLELPPEQIELAPERIELAPPRLELPPEQIELAPEDDELPVEQIPLEPEPEPERIELAPARLELPPEEDDDIIEPPAEPIELLPDDDEIDVLEEAERLVARSRRVSEDLFEAARWMPEYKRVLATRERSEQFKAKLLAEAERIDARIDRDGDGPRLPDEVLEVVVSRLANRIAAWEHSPERQKERQRKQVASRRRKTRGRDLRIIRAAENGDSLRTISLRFKVSKSQVARIVQRFQDEAG